MDFLLDTPLVLKNFVDKETMSKLNSWCIENHQKDFFQNANMGIPDTRKTTRYSKNDFLFPKEAYNVQKRIINYFYLDFVFPKFKDGTICGIGFSGSDIHPHKDPVHHPQTYTLHCNLVSQKAEHGGTTHIENEEYDFDEGDVLCFIPSKNYHYVTAIRGETPRILWIFGFSIKTQQKGKNGSHIY